MKRLHLFEIEDLQSCPLWLRTAITDMLSTVHQWFDTSSIIESELLKLLPKNHPVTITDLCSGSGGPMPDVVRKLRQRELFADTELRLTDLYPNESAVRSVNSNMDETFTRFEESSVDATEVPPLADSNREELRTMICCFHHMPPEIARSIIDDTQRKRQPMLIFEMSDNSVPPVWLWWITLLPNLIFGFLVAFFLRPMTLARFFFSFCVPVIPFAFAWEGAVSNVRTYDKNDFEELLNSIKDENYSWEVSRIPGTMVSHLVVLGRPHEQTGDHS